MLKARAARIAHREILYRDPQGQLVPARRRQPAQEEHVVTPGGLRPHSLVHTLELGHRLRQAASGFQKLDSAGHVLQDLPWARFRSELATKRVAGWVVLASWTNSGGAAVESFSCSWQVPAPPRTDSGQTLLLYSAVGSADNIVQPVLQWSGRRRSWSISSWYVEPTGMAVHTAPVAVQPGEQLTGLITAERAVAGKATYTCEFVSKSGTRLVVPELPELNWFLTALEAYDVRQRSDYPDTQQTLFSSVTVRFGGPAPQVSWRPITRSNAFGETMTVTENGGTAAKIAVNYGKNDPATATAPAAATAVVATPARPVAGHKADARSFVNRVLGSGFIFVLALAAIFGTAAFIERDETKQSFTAYCALLSAEIFLPAFLAGIIAKGRVLGVLIDDRNRMSLGRFQALSWWLLIFAAFLSMYIWNVQHGGGHLPQVPKDLLYLLGITNGSAVIGTMVLNPKRRLTQAVAQNVPPDPAAAQQSTLHVNLTPAEASWTDLFFGEESSNSQTVDVSRLQQFTFTLILLFVYGGKVLDTLGGAGAAQLDLPDLDPSALELLGISNGAYLLTKQTAKPAVTPT